MSNGDRGTSSPPPPPLPLPSPLPELRLRRLPRRRVLLRRHPLRQGRGSHREALRDRPRREPARGGGALRANPPTRARERGAYRPASHRLEEIDACSAECEVHIAQEWLEKLPPPSYEERYVLTRASRNRILNKHARLGCQVVLSPELQGMVVALPEPKPWDTP
uniref:2Fe-2S ferredoxin-type domain-containing protein n=1 Tax=Ananas comosus var. bracteatus TaxID=296719 RepID=A0A6V7Q801_ANACO|nr:unnamed protein product [Ananas comosus var. bracteatus]